MKKLHLTLIIILLSLTLKAAERKVVKIEPKRIIPKISVTKKTTKNNSYYYTLRDCILTSRLQISNKNRAPISDYSATVYIIGEHTAHSQQVCIIDSYSEDISIEAGKTFSGEKKSFQFSYYDDDDYFSYSSSYRKYYSYLIVLKDADGKQVLVKSPRSKLLKHAAKVIDLKNSYDFFDLKKGMKINRR